MTLHRFFIDFDKAIRTDGELRVADSLLIHQLSKVLRKKSGDQIILLDNKSNEYLSEIRTLTSKLLIVKILETSKNQNEPKLKITLCPSLIKLSRFEWMLEKGTELGVSEFTPILTSRSEAKNFSAWGGSASGGKIERALKIVKEASEQCERGLIPKINEIKSFEEIIERGDSNFIFLDRAGVPISSVRQKFSLPIGKSRENIFILIGPEGGWTIDEVNRAKEKDIAVVSLGPRVLRSETAAIAACSILLGI
jgi:16S rRNA (uracil1498-N3)-methyltransferase